MATRTNHHRRVASGLLAGALLLVPLTGCTEAGTEDGNAAAPATQTPAEDTTDAMETAEPGETAASGTDGGTNADVNCSGMSCTLMLSGDGAQAEILGTTVALSAVSGDRATVRVGDRELSCSQGESISAGPLTMQCTTVSQDSVTMEASLG